MGSGGRPSPGSQPRSRRKFLCSSAPLAKLKQPGSRGHKESRGGDAALEPTHTKLGALGTPHCAQLCPSARHTAVKPECGISVP